MRRFRFARIRKWMRSGNHLERLVALQFTDETIDQLRIDQRLVTLDVNDVRELFQLARYFRDPIRTARVIRRGHRHFGAPIEGRFGNTEIVGGDNEAVEFLRAPAAFPNMPEQRLARDLMQRLAGKPRRAPACGDYSDSFSHVALK